MTSLAAPTSPPTQRTSPLPVHRDLLDIVCCPVTGGPLRQLTPEETTRINERILRGELRHRDGTPVAAPLEMGLVTVDGRYAYLVTEGIAVLLAGGAIALARDNEAETLASALCAEKKEARDFYDQIGWRADKAGNCEELCRTEDARDLTATYRDRCNRRVARHLPTGGKYLLDVACGPVKDQYAGYSEGYDYRVCVDLSIVALRHARRKLGDRGLYLLADITNLPLRDGAVDAAISLHTIYHVPQDEQAQAFRELHRVLKPGGSGVVVYTWGPASAAMKWAMELHIAWKTLFGRKGAATAPKPATPAGPRLYFRPHTHAWFARQDWGFPMDLRVWRSLSAAFMHAYVHGPLLGRALLAAIYALEESFPRLAGRFGQYPMLVMHKDRAKAGADNHGRPAG